MINKFNVTEKSSRTRMKKKNHCLRKSLKLEIKFQEEGSGKEIVCDKYRLPDLEEFRYKLHKSEFEQRHEE